MNQASAWFSAEDSKSFITICWKSLLNGVPNVPTYPTYPTCPRALRALRALSAHAPYVPTCPSIFYRPEN